VFPERRSHPAPPAECHHKPGDGKHANERAPFTFDTHLIDRWIEAKGKPVTSVARRPSIYAEARVRSRVR